MYLCVCVCFVYFMHKTSTPWKTRSRFYITIHSIPFYSNVFSRLKLPPSSKYSCRVNEYGSTRSEDTKGGGERVTRLGRDEWFIARSRIIWRAHKLHTSRNEGKCVHGGGDGGNAKCSNGIAGNRGANRGRPRRRKSRDTQRTPTRTHTHTRVYTCGAQCTPATSLHTCYS